MTEKGTGGYRMYAKRRNCTIVRDDEKHPGAVLLKHGPHTIYCFDETFSDGQIWTALCFANKCYNLGVLKGQAIADPGIKVFPQLLQSRIPAENGGT